MTECSLNSLPGWESITGLQFENLVLSNHKKLIELLHIEPDSIVFANPYFQRKKARSEACQIDYLIQVRDCVCLVEIKFSKNKIGPSVIREVEEKMRKLKLPKYMSCHAVLIHVNGVTDDVMDSDVFSKIIDFGDML